MSFETFIRDNMSGPIAQSVKALDARAVDIVTKQLEVISTRVHRKSAAASDVIDEAISVLSSLVTVSVENGGGNG